MTSFLEHVQKTCSAPNRLGCHRNIPDGHNGWESTGIQLPKRTFPDQTKHNTIGATEYNHTKSMPNNIRRCTHQHFSKLTYRNSITIIITSHGHPTRTCNIIKLTGQTSYYKTTRQHNNSNYSTYKISSPRSCKRSSKCRQHICHHRQVIYSRSIPRPLHN